MSNHPDGILDGIHDSVKVEGVAMSGRCGGGTVQAIDGTVPPPHSVPAPLPPARSDSNGSYTDGSYDEVEGDTGTAHNTQDSTLDNLIATEPTNTLIPDSGPFTTPSTLPHELAKLTELSNLFAYQHSLTQAALTQLTDKYESLNYEFTAYKKKVYAYNVDKDKKIAELQVRYKRDF